MIKAMNIFFLCCGIMQQSYSSGNEPQKNDKQKQDNMIYRKNYEIHTEESLSKLAGMYHHFELNGYPENPKIFSCKHCTNYFYEEYLLKNHIKEVHFGINN